MRPYPSQFVLIHEILLRRISSLFGIKIANLFRNHLTKKSVLNNLTIINSFEIKRVIHFKIILTLGLFHVNKF